MIIPLIIHNDDYDGDNNTDADDVYDALMRTHLTTMCFDQLFYTDLHTYCQ